MSNFHRFIDHLLGVGVYEKFIKCTHLNIYYQVSGPTIDTINLTIDTFIPKLYYSRYLRFSLRPSIS